MAARKMIHAQILLQADEASANGAVKDADIAKSLPISHLTVERVRKRFAEEGLDAAINPKVQTRYRSKKLNGEAEALLIATACSETPKGHQEWILKLLADRLVECEVVDSISIEAVRQTLKKPT